MFIVAVVTDYLTQSLHLLCIDSVPKGPLNLSGTVKDTPRSVRTDGGSHFITNLHNQISDEMDREVLVYDSSVFIAKYLPFVPTDADIAKCTHSMLESHLMLRQDGLLRLKDFVNISDGIDASENVAYEHLATIADSIGQCKPISEGRSRNRIPISLSKLSRRHHLL